MPLASVLCVLTLLPLQGAFKQESLTVVEGQALDLHCAFPGHHRYDLEWKNPCGFVIFLNNWEGLRDQRYTITHYSKAALSIRLSNVTVHDEGVYTCLSYGSRIRRKEVNVTVLAAPSKLLLEVSWMGVHSKEEKAILRCSTCGSKPLPQITWLLDNGMEIFGDMRNQLETKKFNSTSILSVHTYTLKSFISCVVRHKALGEEKLMSTLYLEAPDSTTEFALSAFEFTTKKVEKSQNVSGKDSEKQPDITEANSNGQTTSTNSEATPLNSKTTNAESNETLNVMEGNFTTQAVFSSTDMTTLNSQITYEANLTYQGIIKKDPSVLLPILVSMTLFVLFIIILLFVMKLHKGYRNWKKDKDVAEQTVESNRSKANSDNLGEKKIGHLIPWKTSKKYIIQGSCTRTSKNSEESQDSSVFEKQIPYIKETDF